MVKWFGRRIFHIKIYFFGEIIKSSGFWTGVVLKFQPIRRTYFTMAAILHFDLHQQRKFERSVSRSQDDNRFKVMTTTHMSLQVIQAKQKSYLYIFFTVD